MSLPAQPELLAHLAPLHLALLVVRAAEAWEPVIFGGLIPLLGAGAVFFLIWYAVRKPPGEEEETKKGRP